MVAWAILLIISVAGIFVILLRRLPVAMKVAIDDLRRAAVDVPPVRHSVPTAPSLPEKSLTDIPTVSLVVPVSTVPRLGSGDIPALEAQAEEAFRERDFTAARSIYETLLTLDNRQPKWYNRLGIICLELEEFRAARDAFRQALNFDVRVASRHVNLAMAELALGHRVTALSHLRKAIALAPNVKRYHDLLEEMGG